MTPPSPSHSDPPAIPDYDLLKPIGRGSYGEVWLARSVTGVFRVIKIVRRSRFDNDRPFRRELQGISRFQAIASGRPRQLALLHVGRNEEAGYFYYVMEPADDAVAGSSIHPDTYVPLTLKELLHRRGRLPAADCVQIALDLARALAVLHDERLIHRDIKPSNVIFVQGVPKLADVGLVASSDATLTSVGTHGYVPPEGPGSPAADLYSLGKLVYEMFTGLDRLEFPTIPPHLIEGSDASLVRELNAIILRACQPQPQQRHASAHDLARDLELVQAGRSVAFYEGIRRRFRLIATAAILIATATATLAFVLSWRSQVLHRANENARRALYRSDIAVAQLAHASGDLGRARAALQRQIPEPGESDLRGIEWNILNHEVRGDGTPLESVPNAVGIRRLVTEPTGRWLAGSLVDDTVALWELPAGRLVRILTNAPVLGGFTPDGLLVVDEAHRALRFEHPLTGPVRTIQTGQRLYQLLPNGNLLTVSPQNDFIFYFNNSNFNEVLATYNVSKSWIDFGITATEMPATGNYIIAGLFRDHGAVRERYLTSINIHNKNENWRKSLIGRILWIRCSPDSQVFVANIGGINPTIFSSASGEPIAKLVGHEARVQDAIFSHTSEFIATASADQTIRIWETGTSNLLHTYRGLGRPASAVVWTHNDDCIIAGDETGSIIAFQFPTQPQTDVYHGLHSDIHGSFVLDRDCTLVAASKTTNSVLILEQKTLQELTTIKGAFQPVVFSEDGSELLAFNSNWALQWHNLHNNAVRPTPIQLPVDITVSSMAINSANQLAAIVSTDGKIGTINLSKNTITWLQEPESTPIWGITFDSSGQNIWTGNSVGVVRRRNLSFTNQVESLPSIGVEIQALEISNNNRWLVAAIYTDTSIRIFDLENKEWLAPRLSHRRFVQSLQFTKLSDRLLSAGADGRVVVWGVPSFIEIASFEVGNLELSSGDEGIFQLKISDSCHGVAALTEDGRLKFWRTK